MPSAGQHSGTPSAAPDSGTPSAVPALACSICQDDVSPGGHVARLGCGHTFRFQRLDMWVAAQTSQRQLPACPRCRLPLEVEARAPVKVGRRGSGPPRST